MLYQTKYLQLLTCCPKFGKSGKVLTLNDIENSKIASRYQIASTVYVSLFPNL